MRLPEDFSRAPNRGILFRGISLIRCVSCSSKRGVILEKDRSTFHEVERGEEEEIFICAVIGYLFV